MNLRSLALPSPSAVAAGQTAYFQVPVGRSYRAFFLEYQRGGAAATEAQMISDLTSIRINIDGQYYWQGSAAQWLAILKFHGLTVTSGIMPLIFCWPTSRTPVVEDATALGTADVSTCTIEVDIAGGTPTPVLSGNAWFDDRAGLEARLGAVITQNIFSAQASAAGVLELSTLPKGIGDLCDIHFNSAAITAIVMEMDGIRLYEASIAVWNYLLTQLGWTPQTNWVHISPIMLNRLSDRLPIYRAQDLRFKLTLSGAATVPIVMRTVASPKSTVVAG